MCARVKAHTVTLMYDLTSSGNFIRKGRTFAPTGIQPAACSWNSPCTHTAEPGGIIATGGYVKLDVLNA